MNREPWQCRLLDAIEKDRRSDRAISLAASLGQNYVNEMKRTGKMPAADKVYKLCRALGVSMTYIFTGSQVTAKEERLLAALSLMSEEDQDRLLELAERLRQLDEGPPEEARLVYPGKAD